MSSVNIIGSGIIGMLNAHELLKKGFQVNLFDQGHAGQESTWAGGGIISPLFPWRYDDAVTALSLLSQDLYPSILDELRAHSDIDPEYLHSGLLMLDCEDTEHAKKWAEKFDVFYQQLDSATLNKNFSALNNHFSKAIWMPQIHQIRNPRFAKLCKQSLINQGVTFHENTPINEIKMSNDAVQSIHSNQQIFHADITLVCTGAWTGELINPLDQNSDKDLKINPVHGQMLLLKCEQPVFNEVILNDGRYIIPRKDGHVLVGSTTEMIGFKKQTTEKVREELLSYAINLIPQLKNASIAKHWSGLRPGSIKGIPTISAHKRFKNLYINAGHYRNGLVTAPASAKLMQQIITGAPLCLEPKPYNF